MSGNLLRGQNSLGGMRWPHLRVCRTLSSNTSLLRAPDMWKAGCVFLAVVVCVAEVVFVLFVGCFFFFQERGKEMELGEVK